MNTTGGVDFRLCKAQPTTVYLIVPVEVLHSKAVYLRLALSAALRVLYRHGGLL